MMLQYYKLQIQLEVHMQKSLEQRIFMEKVDCLVQLRHWKKEKALEVVGIKWDFQQLL
ncbi:hypothetical protein EUBVEN_01590 [Eubacterium ventriosum ATCC 27560]|uniref:Uncharacterized protein n=1 Tax=Eubacterium ventriosum ATCC 27560 TaxID=411463 RepID=A5Z7A7_9FIRM|nr:hypothetical protein EUBVEN_01590 [Eubacterium ventriosum ATCC 27560]